MSVKLPVYVTAYDELKSADLAVSPAELHGLLTGMLCGGLPLDNQSWKPVLYDYTNDGLGWSSQALQLAQNLYDYCIENLSGDGLEFEMLLAGEEELVIYAETVSDWVNHFISGIGLSGAQLIKLPEQSKEALADLEEIARLGIDEDDDMQEQAALLEQVIEHVKACVLIIHAELGQKPAHQTDKKTVH